MKKFLNSLSALVAAAYSRHFPRHGRNGASKFTPVALANQLGGIYDHGHESLQIDPASSLPIASKHLVYKRGSTQYFASVADGVSLPLGSSPDAPFQMGDFFSVNRFGAVTGMLMGFSAGAITIDDYVYSAANGLVGGLATAGHGTFWIIGRATNTVGAASQEVTYIPCFPYQLSQ